MKTEKQNSQESASAHGQLSTMLGHLSRARSELHKAMDVNDYLSGGLKFVGRLREIEDGLSVLYGLIETDLGNIEDDGTGETP